MSPVKTGGGGTIHGTCHGSRCPQTADDPDHIALHYPGDASLLLRWICTVRRRAAQPATNHRGQPGNAVEDAHTTPALDYTVPDTWRTAARAAAPDPNPAP